MAVVYLFDSRKRLKSYIRNVVEIIHKEGEYTAITELVMRQEPEYGDHFGFQCADGRFRLFLINTVEKNDEAGYMTLTGYDAALAELNSRIVTGLSLKDTTLREAAAKALENSGWVIGKADKNEEIDMKDAYFETAWAVLRNIASVSGVRVVPYYEFSGNEITAKKIDLPDKTPVFRGLILTRRKGARNSHIIKEGTPFGRVYPVGKIIGSGDPPEQTTIADAVWSVARGDPADKPKGQLWVALPGAVTDAEYVFEDKREEDAAKLLKKGFEDLQKKASPKASGTATISELEHVPGYEHRAVRMWDLLPVRTEDGEVVEATVINITRYHVNRHLTKIEIGDEDEEGTDLESMLASMSQEVQQASVGAGGAGAAAKQNKIDLSVTTAHVEELEGTTTTFINETSLWMDGTDVWISATQSTVDNLGNEAEQMRADINVNAAGIELRVKKGEVIAAINVSAEEGVKIDADKVDLGDYATVEELDAEIADIALSISKTVATGTLEANSAIIKAMTYNEEYCTWKSKTVQTSIPEFTKATITDANGNSRTVVTGWATAPSSERSTIYYLSHN